MFKSIFISTTLLFSLIFPPVLADETHQAHEKSDAKKSKSQKELADDYYNKAAMFHFKGEYAKAFEYFQKSAKLGHSAAKFSISGYYRDGFGVVKKDLKKSLQWCIEAAKEGNLNAQYNMGVNYLKGNLVPKDAKEALFWFGKAAEKGDSWAQSALGSIYLKGEVVKKDPEKAFKYYKLAADQEFVPAMNQLGELYENGVGVNKNIDKAIDWYKDAAFNSSADANYNLGRINEGKNNKKVAIFYYEAASKLGLNKAKVAFNRLTGNQDVSKYKTLTLSAKGISLDGKNIEISKIDKTKTYILQWEKDATYDHLNKSLPANLLFRVARKEGKFLVDWTDDKVIKRTEIPSVDFYVRDKFYVYQGNQMTFDDVNRQCIRLYSSLGVETILTFKGYQGMPLSRFDELLKIHPGIKYISLARILEEMPIEMPPEKEKLEKTIPVEESKEKSQPQIREISK